MAKSYYCFLEKFNNYFNRKIIRYETLAEYITASNDHHIPVDANSAMTPFDFNPNDNVTTEIIANDLDFEPDYFLELDASENILSRWFIIEQKRNRQGQWLYSLKRDVISDNVENLLTAPVYIQKAILPETNPLILNSEGMNFNQIKSDETLLKDKTGVAWYVAYIAKSKGGSDVNVQIPTSKIPNSTSLREIATAMGTTEGVLNSIINIGEDTSTKAYFSKSVSMKLTVSYVGSNNTAYTEYDYSFVPDFSSGTGSKGVSGQTRPDLFGSSLGTNQNLFTNLFKNAVIDKKLLWQAQIKSILSASYFLTDEQFNILYGFNGRYIKYLGKYYKLQITDNGTHTTSVTNISNDGTYSAIGDTVTKTVSLAYGVMPLHASLSGKMQRVRSNERQVIISLAYLSDSDDVPQLDAVISAGRNVTEDQQFDLICMPAGAMELIYDDNGTPTTFETVGEYARRIMAEYALQEDANVYDVQLLPYCPLDYLEVGSEIQGIEGEDFDYITSTGPDYIFVEEDIADHSPTVTVQATYTEVSCTISGMQHQAGEAITVDDYEYQIYSEEFEELSNISISIDDSTGILSISYRTVGAVTSTEAEKVIFNVKYHYASVTKVVNVTFYCQSASFQQQLNYQLSLKESMKIDSQCDMYRLLSPNYQGTFEFNVAKNGGAVDYFTAYCTYKPYTPFIKVCPAFNYVYGADYNDNRGLICGGDFSIPRMSSAWQAYQLNNKNYQNIFNREIQNLDLMQSLEMRQQLISGGIGIGTDSLKGAMAGAMAGGGWGAVAGGVIGASASAVGYGIDIDIMSKRHQEARSIAIDKYNYQLGNIKALPYTLTKVGAFDISSKIFPVLEYYTCTEEEKEALRNKIKYESMTVMAIGQFGDYYKVFDELKYFKGELIRNDEIADDSHVLDAIYAELLKGVYM